MIAHESDVRTYVREASGGKARWVEPALGSTPGLPDCWVPFWADGHKHCVHIELKCGSICGGHLQFTVRPEQKREIRSMKADGIKVGFIVGIEGTHQVAFLKPDNDAMSGKVRIGPDGPEILIINSKIWKGDGFWCGVNFIFSD